MNVLAIVSLPANRLVFSFGAMVCGVGLPPPFGAGIEPTASGAASLPPPRH